MITQLLAHPLTKGLDINSPQTTHLRKRIIQEKAFLKQIYAEWYQAIAAALPNINGQVLELGAGAGFQEDYIPGLITSEVFACPDISLVADGLALPFSDYSLRAIVMTDVFHHLPDAEQFLREAARCVKPGGRLVMIEPWVTNWSKLIYTNLHHEPFLPEVQAWEFPADGPLSSANGALPWIVFQRDQKKLTQEFPVWRVDLIRPFMPFRYLVSGGVSLRTLMPSWSFNLWRALETGLHPWANQLGMFAQIVVTRT